jgi:uncharacterized protein (UPF0332 family)
MDEELGRRVFQQFIDLFFRPEIERRRGAGALPAPLVLRKAQVVFYPDGRRPEVRLNDEVRAVAKVRFKPGAMEGRRVGDEITADEIDDISEVMLKDEDDPDAGHATFIQVGKRWCMAFDFRYNKGLSERHLNDAREFLEAARHSQERSAWSAFVDNLFSAAELAARALLLVLPDREFRRKATHKAIHARFNRFANLGSVAPEGRAVFNKLYGLRPSARYGANAISFDRAEAETLLRDVENLIHEVSQTMSRPRRPGG